MQDLAIVQRLEYAGVASVMGYQAARGELSGASRLLQLKVRPTTQPSPP